MEQGRYNQRDNVPAVSKLEIYPGVCRIWEIRQLGHCKFMGIRRAVYGVSCEMGLDRDYQGQMGLGSTSIGG